MVDNASNFLLIACDFVISELITYALIGSFFVLAIACNNLSSINELVELFIIALPPPVGMNLFKQREKVLQ